MTKKKIVVFTTSYLPFIGGAEIAVREVARRLYDSYDIYMITARQNRMYPKQEMVPEGTIIRLGFGTVLDKWLLPFAGFFELLKLGMGGHIPKPWKQTSRNSLLIWGMDISQGSLSACLCKFFFPALPFILTVQYGYGDARLGMGRMGAIGLSFRRMLRLANAVTAISSYLFNAASEYGYAGIARIIPNGVDTSLFAFQPLKIRTDNNHIQRVIITTSRLVKKNGVDVLIRAVEEIKKTGTPITCYIIGGGPERAALEKLTNDLQLSRDVIFFGAVPYEEIPFYLRKADVFVRPSRSEGMGNSFIEALSVGIPVIGTPVGGIPDIIKDGEMGLLCRVDDIKDTAEKILMLLNDSALAARIRENGRRLVERIFSWNNIAKSYAHMFEKLLYARARVLICTPLYPPEIGGPATYARILTQHCLDAGIGLRILRFGEVRRLPKIMRHAIYFLRVLMRARGCDYILALDPVSVGFPAACGAFILRKPLIIKIVGDYAWEQGVQRFGVSELLDDFLKKSYGWRLEWLRKIQQFSVRRARGIIVPSEYLKRVVSAWGIDAEKICVIANAEDIEMISESHKDLRKILSLSGTVLFSAGRLVPWKGFKLLIELMPELMGEHPDITLLIAGSGPQKEELESLIAAYGLQSRVRLLGSVAHADILRYIKGADAFVLASTYEGLSHAVLEAMSMGALVIASNVGGNPELIEHDKNGFLFDLNDRKKIIQAIRETLAMPEDKKIAIRKAAITSASRYTSERMAEATAQYILNL